MCQPADETSSLKRELFGSRNPFLKFFHFLLSPPEISGMAKARDFKFSIRVDDVKYQYQSVTVPQVGVVRVMRPISTFWTWKILPQQVVGVLV